MLAKPCSGEPQREADRQAGRTLTCGEDEQSGENKHTPPPWGQALAAFSYLIPTAAPQEVLLLILFCK